MNHLLASKFLKAYGSVPEDERSQPIVIIEGKTYNWNRAYDEVNAGTELGIKIIKKMHEVGLL